MRPIPALLALGILPAALALPVVTAPSPSAHRVAPRVQALALAGVDSGAMAAMPAVRDRPVLLTRQTATRRFDLVAVTWDAGSAPADAAVRVRVREHGAWTAWETLEPDPDGPDSASADAAAQRAGERAGSESLLTDGADGIQVRVDGARAPQDVRAELIDGGRSAFDATVPGLTARRAASTASADAAMPAIVTRAQWGADESLRRGTPSYTGTPKVGFIHHTASTNAYSPADAAAQIRAIYAYHTQIHKWSDIGYNYLVDQYGTIYEGRAGGLDQNVLGAHTGGFNTSTFAVSELGNFQTGPAPDVMVESIAQVMAWRLTIAHRDPAATAQLTSQGGGTSKYKAGAVVTVPVIAGHRDVGSTACPGANLYVKIPAIRARVAELMGPMIYNPVVTPSTIPPGPDGRAAAGSVAVTARTSDPQNWTLTVSDGTGAVVASSAGATTPENLTLQAAWDRTVAGQPAAPGTYGVTLASTSPAGAVHSFTTTVLVQAPAPVVVAPAPAPAPVVTPTPPPVPVLPDPPQIAVIYTTPGTRTRSGRSYTTTCAEFGTTHRCAAVTLSSYFVRAARTGRMSQVSGPMITAYGYTVRYSPAWEASLWTANGIHSIDKRLWLVVCNVPTGPRICNVSVRAAVWERVVVKHPGAADTVVIRARQRWKLNRVYRLFVTA